MARQATSPHLVVALFSSVLVASCTTDLPPGAKPPSGATGQTSQTGAGDSSAASSASLSTATPEAYNPKKDPLVNPPSLFEKAPADPAASRDDETLIRHLPANPGSLNPLFYTSRYDGYLVDLLYDGLFNFDAAMQWMVNTEVVESCEDSPDKLRTTVKLRPGLKWQDGQPWTAADVRFSFEKILDERVPCTAVRDGTDQLKDVEVIDERTVVFVHKEPRPTNTWNMLFPIIPKHIYGIPERLAEDPSLEKSAYYNRCNRETVVGNGAYKLVRWVPNQEIVVERWEDFHGRKPRFKKQILKIHRDQNTALLLFKKGQLDEMELMANQFAMETKDAEFAKHGVKSLNSEWSFYCFTWNQDGSNPFFNDVRVRRAMAHAIDVDRIIREVHYSLYEPCLGMYHRTAKMFNPEVKRIPYDHDQARALLDSAGWLVASDGWRYKTINGQRVKFEFELMMPKENPYIAKVAARAAEELKAIGVSMTQRVIEFVAQTQRAEKHEFQAMAGGWGTGTDPDTQYNLLHSTSKDGGRNYGCYSNPEVDRLFELGRRELDLQKRMEHYRQIHKHVYNDQPMLFLWNKGILWAFNKNLRGITTSPRGVFGFAPSYMDWWVPKGISLRQD